MIEAFSVAIVTCCISWMSSANVWSEFKPLFGWMEACFKFFDCSSWRLIVFVLDLVEVVFVHDSYDYLRFHRVVGYLSLSGFVVQLVDSFLKLQSMLFSYCIGYCWLFPLFSFWFGWLNFTDEFRVCFSGICLFTILELAIFARFFLLSCWYATSCFLFTLWSRINKGRRRGGGHNKCVGEGEEGLEHYVKSNKSNK